MDQIIGTVFNLFLALSLTVGKVIHIDVITQIAHQKIGDNQDAGDPDE